MSEVRVGVRPANGTEGDIMRDQLCDWCAADHEWHRHNADLQDQPDESCPIIMDALAGEHSYPNEQGPPQWSLTSKGEWRCTAFVRCPCDVDGPPTEPVAPKPIPGQFAMFPTEHTCHLCHVLLSPGDEHTDSSGGDVCLDCCDGCPE